MILTALLAKGGPTAARVRSACIIGSSCFLEGKRVHSFTTSLTKNGTTDVCVCVLCHNKDDAQRCSISPICMMHA